MLSPPYFCAFTETAADLANQYLNNASYQPHPHPLTHWANTPGTELADTPTNNTWHRPPILATTPTHPLAYVDIYVDDFLVLAQGLPQTLNNVRTTLFNAIDEVFASSILRINPFIGTNRSQSKNLKKGDARWTTRKVMLGWVIELPPHRAERLLAILQSLLQKRRVSLKIWQQHIGELQSMALALPGGRGMFSTLYTAIDPSQTRIRINKQIGRAHV